jgi:hypothetical protein
MFIGVGALHTAANRRRNGDDGSHSIVAETLAL